MPQNVETSLDLESLKGVGPGDRASILEAVLARIEAHGDKAVWIHRPSRESVMAALVAAEKRAAGGVAQPLLGVPFAVKDNIDVAGMPTTAACPAFAYTPTKSATVVQKLLDAGAILVGKTNMDQFATGLVGVRSPYGVPKNPFDTRYIPGGSSSGSAVAVATGLVSFALGTDTAGSGRVPAAFNNIVGLKPTCGVVSTSGVVPACRSLDCVSIFALTCGDARAVVNVIGGFDAADPYSRPMPQVLGFDAERFTFGVPQRSQLRFFGDQEAQDKFDEAVARFESLGGRAITINYEPFAEAARLLYGGPWVAERVASLRKFAAAKPEAMLPVMREVLAGAKAFDAAAAFEGMHKLESLRRRAAEVWKQMDVLLLPTTGTIYTVAEVMADPIELNSNLGYYTNFVNLLDCCAAAVPGGFGTGGLPRGVTLIAPAGQDESVTALADRFQRATGLTLGATGASMPTGGAANGKAAGVKVAVVGAHLAGQPLNFQLTERGAKLIRGCRTKGGYRLFALPGTVPPKPGLLRGGDEISGSGVEVEIWGMSVPAFGSFVAAVPPPLVIGTIELEDGELVKGFLCESHATAGARDITGFGGWRAYLASKPI
jgi:allophanate hydrolase